ncbi:proteasome-interacting protein cic1 [Saxophila tyrrhenica]|uniref:Proteasome-interacting protein cic1 n=1 Tax=Saxophila tyrrhenica TaxID=1690608 RepID=A0AAV9PNG6_9PEZI|nr:proteasome-interacting protein cic1 [Saxophila tyrrhenica]
MALTTRSSTGIAQQLDPSQTLRASTALLKKIQSDQATKTVTAEKPSLLADADENEAADDIPVWLVLTTKKHIIDKVRLKPGKIALPYPYLDTSDATLRICLITADPQRKFKDLIAHPSFPLELPTRIKRVIGLEKLKAKYKSNESRRQLLGEYDVFLADDRIVTFLPTVLGKVFYRGGSKRPIPITMEGKRQNFDEQGNKRRKLAEGGTKVVKEEVTPAAVAKEVEKTLSSTLVHLAPSTTTSVKVGKSSMEPEQLQANVTAVTEAMVEKYVPQKWRNVRAVHMKGPDTAALPLYLADQLWEDEKDVLEEAPAANPGKKSKKRKASALAEAANGTEANLEVIEVPGPDGKMRRIEKSSVKQIEPPVKAAKKVKAKAQDEDEVAKAAERAEKAARKEALQKQKVAAKAALKDADGIATKKAEANGVVKPVKAKKVRTKAADLI